MLDEAAGPSGCRDSSFVCQSLYVDSDAEVEYNLYSSKQELWDIVAHWVGDNKVTASQDIGFKIPQKFGLI